MQKNKAFAKNRASSGSLGIQKPLKRSKSSHTRERGRPTLINAQLVGNRDKLVYVLETYWPKIGWQLKTSRTASDIPLALKPIRGKADEGRIGLFLRADSVVAKPILIRKMLKTLEIALEDEGHLQKVYEKQLEACQLAEAGVFEACPDNRVTLEREITYRLNSVRTLEKDCVAKEKALRIAEYLMSKMESASLQGKPADLHGEKIAYQGAKGLSERAALVLRDEREILRRAKERLRAATPARLELANKIACECRQRLKDAQTQLAQAGIDRGRLEETLRDHQAGFAQTELVTFIRSKRAANTPRMLADAMAGLPEISCRVSFRRCRKLPFEAGSALNMQVFEFIERCLRKRTSTKTTHVLKLFRSEIGRMPRTRRIEAGRVENFFRKHLEDNWWALKAAITNTLKSRHHPGELPFVLTDGFLMELSKPQTNLDRLLHESEKLGF